MRFSQDDPKGHSEQSEESRPIQRDPSLCSG